MSQTKSNSCNVGKTPCVECGAPSKLYSGGKYLCTTCASVDKTAAARGVCYEDALKSMIKEHK